MAYDETLVTPGGQTLVYGDKVGPNAAFAQAMKIISGIENEVFPWAIDFANRGLIYPDGLRKRLKDEFSGAALDLTKWTPTQFGGGTIAVAGSVLTLGTGDAVSGSGVELLSVDTFTAPCRLIAILNSISQRIANQEFSIELVEAGTAAGSAGTDAAKILFNGTVNTTQQVTTLCTGDQDGPTNWTGPATNAAAKYEIDLMPDEVWYYAVSALNSTGGRSNFFHSDRKTPDPTKTYRIRIRLRNTGAAASATTVALDAITVEDNAYLPVEVAHARGSTAAGEGLPVNIAATQVSTIAQLMETHGIAYDDVPGGALGAGATQTGTARDVWAGSIPVAGGVVSTGGNRYIGRFRAFAAADQIGTLRIEVSKDNVTWDPQAEIATTVIGGKNVAKLDEPIISRFYRVVYINGATLQGATMRLFSEAVSMP